MPRPRLLPPRLFHLAALLASLPAAATGASHGAAPPTKLTNTRVASQPTKRAQATTATRPAAADSATNLVARGVAALEAGDAQAAKSLFTRALKIEPKNVEAHTYLGALADRAGELREAEKHFAAAASLAPRSPQALNNYGAILFRLGRTAEAAGAFEASLKLDARQPSALVNLAQIRFAAASPADLSAARALFERARAIAPDTEIARALTVIALRLGDREAAKKYYGEYAARIANTTGASADDNNSNNIISPQSRGELGAALLEAGLFEEAAAELDAVVAADPANVESIVRLARAHRGRKDVAAAGRLLESAIARGLEAAPVYAALADLYESIGRVENAIPAMRLATERAPASEEYRYRYALLLVNTKAPKAAVIRLREALDSFPRSAKLWFALGFAYLSEHQNAEATEALARAVELDPQAAPALAYLGLAYAGQGRLDDAIKFYERAVAINRQLAPVHYLLADALLKRNSADDAVRAGQALLRAVEFDPALAVARLALGNLYLRTGRVESAVEQLKRAAELEPDSVEAHYQLGRAYTRLKRTAEAQAAFAASKRLNEGQRQQSKDDLLALVRRLANVQF
ncbi:MAG TPA: tetratricopeptide repeat protein [Pyrinomonadaceae bacterium]|nr:tetratricopeptide repeat protein [Pyrinomonadaceae bacterium]